MDKHLHSRIERFHNVKIVQLPKLIYRFNTISFDRENTESILVFILQK